MTAAEMAGARGAARLAAGVAAAHARLLAQHRAQPRRGRGRRRLSRPLPRAVRPAARRLPPRAPGVRPAGLAAGHLRRRPRPGAARRREGRRRARRRRGRLPPAATWCSPTPGRTPPTTRRRSALTRDRLARGPGRGAAGAARRRRRPRTLARRRAADRAAVRQVEPAARRRRRARRRPSCCAPSRSASCSSARGSSRPSSAATSPRAGSTNVEWLGAARRPGAARAHAGRRRLSRRVRPAPRRRRAWCPTRSTTRWPAAGPSSPPTRDGAREWLQRRRDGAADAGRRRAPRWRPPCAGCSTSDERARLGEAALALYRRALHAGGRGRRAARGAGAGV